jgi:hypothetical protein
VQHSVRLRRFEAPSYWEVTFESHVSQRVSFVRLPRSCRNTGTFEELHRIADVAESSRTPTTGILVRQPTSRSDHLSTARAIRSTRIEFSNSATRPDCSAGVPLIFSSKPTMRFSFARTSSIVSWCPKATSQSSHSIILLGHSVVQITRSSSKTLVFYRDRIVRVAWDGVALCAVTIEPFEVSLWRGGCGGAMGFQSARAGSWGCRAAPEGVRCPTSMRLVLGPECFGVVRRRLAGVRSSQEDELWRGMREHA